RKVEKRPDALGLRSAAAVVNVEADVSAHVLVQYWHEPACAQVGGRGEVRQLSDRLSGQHRLQLELGIVCRERWGHLPVFYLTVYGQGPRHDPAGRGIS